MKPASTVAGASRLLRVRAGTHETVGDGRHALVPWAGHDAVGSAMTGWTVREAGRADIDALTRLVNTAFAVEHFIYDGERISAEECADLLTTGRALLVERDAAPIGCVYLELRDKSGYLGLLSVMPSRQNQGIGRSLLTTGENWFRSQGRTTSELQIINLRTELFEYYRRLGYRESGTVQWPENVPTHLPCYFIRMTKTL